MRSFLTPLLVTFTVAACVPPATFQPPAATDGGDADASVAEPDASVTDSDAGAPEPDAGVTAPDAGNTLPDGGSASPDAGTTTPGNGITTPDQTWTWVDFPDAMCGNGAPTGLGVNLSSTSTDVLIYLQGGGACWDTNSCFVLKSAINIETGYTAATFAAEPTRVAPPFDRTDPQNPFKDASFVFIPYCTGDLHAGAKATTYTGLFGAQATVHHVGARNIDAFLKRLGPTFSGARHVLLSGSSAGAYGAQMNYHRFVGALPDADIDLLADSGQLVQPYNGRVFEMKTAWDTQAPPGCADCASNFPAWVDYFHATYPTRRFGLLAYESDNVLTLYFSYPLDGTFANATNALRTKYDATNHLKYFELAGTAHTMLGSFNTVAAPSGKTLRAWVTEWMHGDPAWASVKP